MRAKTIITIGLVVGIALFALPWLRALFPRHFTWTRYQEDGFMIMLPPGWHQTPLTIRERMAMRQELKVHARALPLPEETISAIPQMVSLIKFLAVKERGVASLSVVVEDVPFFMTPEEYLDETLKLMKTVVPNLHSEFVNLPAGTALLMQFARSGKDGKRYFTQYLFLPSRRAYILTFCSSLPVLDEEQEIVRSFIIKEVSDAVPAP